MMTISGVTAHVFEYVWLWGGCALTEAAGSSV